MKFVAKHLLPFEFLPQGHFGQRAIPAQDSRDTLEFGVIANKPFHHHTDNTPLLLPLSRGECFILG